MILPSSSCFSIRNMLHYIPVHLRGGDQLWTVPLPTLHVRAAGGYQPRIRLVHVLRLGRAGPHAAGWVPLYISAFPEQPTHNGTQAQARERHGVTEHGEAQAAVSLRPDPAHLSLAPSVFPPPRDLDSCGRSEGSAPRRRPQFFIGVCCSAQSGPGLLPLSKPSGSGSFFIYLFIYYFRKRDLCCDGALSKFLFNIFCQELMNLSVFKNWTKRKKKN